MHPCQNATTILRGLAEKRTWSQPNCLSNTSLPIEPYNRIRKSFPHRAWCCYFARHLQLECLLSLHLHEVVLGLEFSLNWVFHKFKFHRPISMPPDTALRETQLQHGMKNVKMQNPMPFQKYNQDIISNRSENKRVCTNKSAAL